MITPDGLQRPVVIEVEPERVYTDQTVLGDLVLTLRDQRTQTADGGTHVRHVLEISGAGADETGPELGTQISS